MLNMFKMIRKIVIIVIYPSFIRCGFLACITINAKFSPIRFSCFYCGCWWLCRCCCWAPLPLKAPGRRRRQEQQRCQESAVASTCGRPALFPFSSRRNCWQRWLPGLSFNAPCPLLFLLWLPLPQRNARAGVCIWICVLCGASVCVSHCSCGCVFLYFNVCVCECGLYRGRSRRRQVPLPFDVAVRSKNTEMCLQTTASVAPARFAIKFA